MIKGNPHFMRGLVERREELLKRLKSSPREGWDKTKAKFALEYGITIPTVEQYYVLLEMAGLLDETK